MEELYGRAGLVRIMDRGLASEQNVRFLRAGGPRYVLGTAKNSLRKFERELLDEDWKQVHEGLEVRLVPAPGGEEVFICVGVPSGEPRNRPCMSVRETYRRRFTENRRELWQTSAEIGGCGALSRAAPGTKHMCGATVRCACGGGRPGLHATAVDEGGELAGVGAEE
jgi:hypothetical protein